MAHESLQRFVNLRGELESSAIRFVIRPSPVFRTVAQRQPDVGANPRTRIFANRIVAVYILF